MPNADTKDTLMKLTVLTNILTPYRIPLFQAMAEQVDDFSVLLMAEREENRQWELQQPPFKVQVLPAFQIKPKGSEISRHWNYTVIRTLRKLQPDVVLSGGFAPANISAFLYCKMFRKAFIGWGELTLQEPSNASFVRRIIRRLLISLSNGSIASSCAARETFLHYGALPEQVLTVTLPLDVIQLRKRVEEIRKTPRFHEKQPSVSRPVLLSIGRVTKLKGYQELFDTYDQLLTTHPTTSLIIVGDGPDRKYFEDLANQRGWSNIYFIGFVQPEELATYFALSDAFVFLHSTINSDSCSAKPWPRGFPSSPLFMLLRPSNSLKKASRDFVSIQQILQLQQKQYGDYLICPHPSAHGSCKPPINASCPATSKAVQKRWLSFFEPPQPALNRSVTNTQVDMPE